MKILIFILLSFSYAGPYFRCLRILPGLLSGKYLLCEDKISASKWNKSDNVISMQDRPKYALNNNLLSSGGIMVYHFQSLKKDIKDPEVKEEIVRHGGEECLKDHGDFITFQKIAYILPNIPGTFFKRNNILDTKFQKHSQNGSTVIPPKFGEENSRIERVMPFKFLGKIEFEVNTSYVENPEVFEGLQPVLKSSTRQVDQFNTGVVNSQSHARYIPLEDNSGTLVLITSAASINSKEFNFFTRQAMLNTPFLVIKKFAELTAQKEVEGMVDYYQTNFGNQ